MDWFTALALAGQEAPAQSQNSFGIFPMLVVIMLLFYFMIIRPQKRSQREVDDMRNAVKKGDKVKSIGGIIGTVASVDTTNNIVSVQVDRNVKIDFDRNAIATVIKKEDAKAIKEDAKTTKDPSETESDK